MQRGQGSRFSASARERSFLPSLSLPTLRTVVRARSTRGIATVVALALPLTLEAGPARADVELEAAAIGGLAWTRALPSLKSASTQTAAREVRASEVAVGGSLYAIGGGVDVGLAVDDRLLLPGIGVAAYGAVGSYDTVLTSVDGSIARARPWTTYQLDLLLPGVGYRVKHRRFMFVASLRTGVSAMSMGGSVAGGRGDELASLTGVSALVQVELEACRRLDPVTRICAQVAPRIYDFGFMNGATFGVRVEWGR